MNLSLSSVDLRPLHTFGLVAKAERVESFVNVQELRSLLRETPSPHLVLGGGSNVAFVDDFVGTVLLNRIPGRNIVGKDGNLVVAGAGEDWHDLVLWTLDQGLYGLENLSLIPGRVGAAPIQNIGAYGVELSQVFLGCHALDRISDQVIWLDRETCAFGYRDSIFKHNPDRYVIVDVHLKLNRAFVPHLDYGDLSLRTNQLEGALDGIALSKLICEIRREKLPDPCDFGNAGSFFKNPIVDTQLKSRLQNLNPGPPLYDMGNGTYKTSAAWLIDQCGLKGAREGSIAVHERQPLVLINLGGGRGDQLCTLARHIQTTVLQRFGIPLEREVRLLPPPQES